ncbi:hypothetical protein N0V82_008193 [Gnomoniopsis sp. IMI 355080]|nr:hypothetical protein N0V82_008193 [Gnomoniopsis sp. IMI 355080]
MTEFPMSEGEVAFEVPAAGKPCKTWYKIFGSIESTTGPILIGLHGGPGAGHEYITPLADLYKLYHIPVLLYDQIGCGRSTHLREKNGDAKFWSFELFISELDNLIDQLGLRQRGFHLLGQSWGGVFAASYAMPRYHGGNTPKGLRKLIIHGGPASIPLYEEGLKGLLAKLPPDVRKTLEDCDRRGDHESEEFKKASDIFNSHYNCQLKPLPEEVLAIHKHIHEDPTVYVTIQGPAEFVIIGSIKGWEGWKEANTIGAETLLINGKHDEVTNLSIYPWERYMQEVGDFVVSTTPDKRREI